MSTIVTVRPNLTVSYNCGLVGAADRTTALNDNSDSSYITLNVPSAYVRPRFDIPTIPSGSVIASVTPRFRIDANSQDPTRLYASLRLNNTSPSFGSESISGLPTSGLTTVTGIRRTTQPDGTPWTVAALASLYLEIGRNSVGGSSFFVAELYLDVECNYIPVPTGSAPNGNAFSTRPTFGWTYTDTDGDIQSAFRLKVFSDTQIGVTGFDPNTAIPIVDSGIVTSSSTSWDCTVDLINGKTYRAYISIMDGVSNTWSPYISTGPYAYTTIVLDPASGPYISATSVDNTNKRISLTLQERENMMNYTDSDLENGLGSWVNNLNATVTQSTDYALGGTHSVKVVANSDSTGSYTAAQTAGTGTSYATVSGLIIPGNTYSAGISVFKPSGTARKICVSFLWYNSAGTYLSTSTGVDVLQVVNQWTPCFITATAPANAFYVRLFVQIFDMTASEAQYIDHSTIIPGTINQLDDPIFELDDGTGGAVGVASDWVSYISGSATSAYAIDDTPTNILFGSQSQKMTFSSVVGNAGIGSKRNIPVKSGTTYTISAWVKADRAITSFKFYHANLNSGTTSSGYTLAANTWTRVTWTVSATASLSNSQLFAFTQEACTLWIGHIQMEFGSSATVENYNRKYWTRGDLVSLQRFEVQRSTDRINWTDITNRLTTDPTQALSNGVLTNFNTSDSTQYVTVYDYDAPLGTTVYYRIRSKAVLGASTLTSSWSYWTPVVTPTIDPLYWWLKVPNQPSLNYKFGFKGPSWSRKSTETGAFFLPIGRNRKVKVRDVIYGDEFTLTLSAISKAEADAFTAIRNSQQSVLLQATDGRQWFCDFDNTVTYNEIVVDVIQPYEEIEIPFVEVDAPYV